MGNLRDLSPESFGAIGDAVADDTAAFEAMFKAASEETSGVVQISLTAYYRINRTVFLAGWKVPIRINASDSTILSGVNDGFFTIVAQGPGETNVNAQILSTVPIGSNFVTVANSALFSESKVLRVKNLVDPVLNPYNERAQLIDLEYESQGYLVFNQPLSMPVNAGFTATVSGYDLAPPLEIKDLTIKGADGNNAGGLMVQAVQSPALAGLRFDGLNVCNLWASDLMRGSVEDVEATGGGYAGNAMILGGTRMLLRDIRSERSKMFGVTVSNLYDSDVDGLYSNMSYGRGVTLIGSCSNRMRGITAHRAQGAGATGVSLTSGCCANSIIGGTALCNIGAGLWSNGVRNTDNTVVGFVSRQNYGGNYAMTPSDGVLLTGCV